MVHLVFKKSGFVLTKGQKKTLNHSHQTFLFMIAHLLLTCMWIMSYKERGARSFYLTKNSSVSFSLETESPSALIYF